MYDAAFTSIGTTALLILNRLTCQQRLLELQSEEPQDDKAGNQERKDSADKSKAEEERRFIEHRLRELAAFERRLRLGK